MRRYHLIREIIERGDIKICKVRSEDNPTDPLTKPLSQSKHDAHISSIGLRCNQSHMRLSEHKVLDKTHGQDHLIDRRHKILTDDGSVIEIRGCLQDKGTPAAGFCDTFASAKGVLPA
ncbi:hypothetical protein L6452_41963 [Arctium lappa]|uniref:Uncharacterized protein n=1 Tax=Arctium lappa TaxID=4217 RepID=A0ACB8XHH9_ARCLA|nr:hypothetical protein L6452_41963 [Arctium lappa]